MGQKEAHSARVTGQHRPWERPRPIFHVPAGLSQVLLSPGAPHSCPPAPAKASVTWWETRGRRALHTARGRAAGSSFQSNFPQCFCRYPCT